MRILIIEDEHGLVDSIGTVLKNENYLVDYCYDGESGLYAALSDIYDVILLDIMLPKMNGFEVLKKMRYEKVSTPVLMLTARYSLSDKVKGFDAGADDYLTKPFMMEELLARIRALCRRQGELLADLLIFGDLELDSAKSRIKCTTTGKSVQVAQKELQILEYLILNKDQIVTKEQIFVKIWGYESEVDYNNVEVYISFTRKKMLFIGSKDKIKAVRGIGYKIEVQCK
jgi:DNA-binding response OmpR family regulator